MTATVTLVAPETGAEAPKPEDKKPEGERPAWLPENMKDGEQLAQSYAELQAKFTQTSQELATLKKPEEKSNDNSKATEEKPQDGLKVPEQKPEDKKPDEEMKSEEGEQKPQQTEAEKAAAEAVAKAGIDVAPWQEEFNQTRDVSEEGRAKIAESLKAQFGENARQLVDDFIEGQKMRLTNYETTVKAVAGGEEQYAEMMKWAAASLPKAEIEAFNKAVDSNDVNTSSLAVAGLKAKFVAANGEAPNLIGGEAPGGEKVGFASTFEMTQAMGDPRYKTDPAYRKSVEQRAMKSNF